MSAGELLASLGASSQVTHPVPFSTSRPPAPDAPLEVVANYLLDAPNSLRPVLGYLYLLSAVDKGDEAKVAWLLENGVDPNARPAANEALEISGSRVTVKNLAAELSWAIDEGCTPLMLAARSSNANASKLIQTLLKHGAQPPAKDFHSWTALLRAAWNGREQNVRTLIDGVDGRASDVNERDRAGWSAIMRAAWNSHLGTLRLLIQRGTSVDAKDRYGQSALILAASLGHTEAVKLLLEANADWTVKDSKGQTALAVAENFRHSATANVLRAWAAAHPAPSQAGPSHAGPSQPAAPILPSPRVNGKTSPISLFAEGLTEDKIYGVRSNPLTVPGAFGDPDPEPEQPSEPEPEIVAAPYAAHLPGELQASLDFSAPAIQPELANALTSLLQRIAAVVVPSEAGLLTEFATMNAVNEENVRDGVVKRMEAVRHLADGIGKFESFLGVRDVLKTEAGEIAEKAETGVVEKQAEVEKLDKVAEELEMEKATAVAKLDAVRSQLATLEETLGLPVEAASAVLEASTSVSTAVERRAAGLAADRSRTDRERLGFRQAAETASAVSTYLASQIEAAKGSKVSLEAVLLGAEQTHAAYLRELVARSLRVLHTIRRSLEQASEDADQALAMGLKTRHDRLKKEHRGLEEELEEARRLKSWYERCLAELEHSIPVEEPETKLVAPQQIHVEVAPETPVTSAIPHPSASGSQASASVLRLPDAASHAGESSDVVNVTEQGLRPLAISETEAGSEASHAVQLEDVDLLSRAPSLQQQDAPTAEASEVSSDDFSHIEHAELVEELEVTEEEVTECSKTLVVDN